MSEESSVDWYETISITQPDSVEIMGENREQFNNAFESLTTGYYDSAFKGLLELSEKGSSISQYFLGVMYLSGEGVLQDFLQAHKWFNIASSQGHKIAKEHLQKLTKDMSPTQAVEAQRLACECVAKKYKVAS